MSMMNTKRLVALMASGALLAGCVQLNTLFGPNKNWNSPDCMVTSEVPAPIFHVSFVSPASAGATVSLEPWVYLSAPAAWMDEVLPTTFRADVNTAAKEIVISGKVRRKLENPQAACAIPAMYVIPDAATLSLPVVLTEAGTYTVRIASESFTTQRPPEVANPSLPPRVYPPVAATKSLVIN